MEAIAILLACAVLLWITTPPSTDWVDELDRDGYGEDPNDPGP